MRKFILIVFLVLNIMIVSGQNGLKQGEYFLLLNNKHTISLNTFKDNTINEIKTFEITEKSIYVTDQESRVAILDTVKNNVKIYDFQSSKEYNLVIPFALKVYRILLTKDNLFLGGEMGKEILVQYHFPSNEWFSLEIPVEMLFPGKAIDDIVINDTFLIAIDNIVLPKFVLYYHLNETGRLSLSHFKELKSNGTYESIHQARITSKYLGLFSKTISGYIGASEHITIYNDLDLKKSFAISIRQQEKDYHTFNDFIIIGDKLFIASKEKGLGMFMIKDSYFKAKKNEFDVFNTEVSFEKIKYNPYDNGEILSLTIVPGNSTIILTIKNKIGRISHEIVDVNEN